ncbi:MAG: protein-L-isoaspartate(D-aspartate) O-methyltransferase [Acidobacteriota bacterium]
MKDYNKLSREMVSTQLKSRGIKDKKVLKAMEKVPRHKFVPENLRHLSYNDEPLPIGEGQTISQPYIVAYMTEKASLQENDKVLEIGTGSGYQTAILAKIAHEVYTVEVIPSLQQNAKNILNKLGYGNIRFRTGDGTKGWEEPAPYEAIIVTAAPPRIPEKLLEQLKDKGRLVIPIGEGFQDLYLIIKDGNKIKKERLLPVRFVPLISTH